MNHPDQNAKRDSFDISWVEQIRQAVIQARQIFRQPKQGIRASSIQEQFSHQMDAQIVALLTSILETSSFDVPVSLAAVGGYGRLELAPYSDLDLVFLMEKPLSEKMLIIPERLHRCLWDAGLNVGFSIRTMEECLEDAQKDIIFQTSLLDLRYLWGDARLIAHLTERLRHEIFRPNRQNFISAKLDEQALRHKRYGGSVYILEPNVKEGAGGLRDYHTALWVAKICFLNQPITLKFLLQIGQISSKTLKSFERALGFLWRIRHLLHLSSNKKNDQLRFAYHEEMAKALGFKATNKGLSVEHFMRTLYLHARTIERESTQLIEQCLIQQSVRPFRARTALTKNIGNGLLLHQGKLTVQHANVFSERPSLLMELFARSANEGFHLHPHLKSLIQANFQKIDEKFRFDPEVNRAFFQILKQGSAGSILETMHDIGILARYIPEFRKVVCKMQHDLYHVYTVDQHLLITVKHLHDLISGKDEWGRFIRFSNSDDALLPILFLGGLLHDIGKGYGSGHSERGARIVQRVGRRMGLSAQEMDLLVFLVAEHLTMTHTSQRRDLNDDELIENFAHRMENPTKLNFLTLLTIADMRSVGPEVFSEWKGMLLKELYEKTYQKLTQPQAIKHQLKADARRKEAWQYLVECSDDATIHHQFQIFLSTLSDRYFLLNMPHDIVEHFFLFEKMSDKTTILRSSPKNGSEIIVSTQDAHGRLAQITGTMAACGINIHSAQINTRENGMILDIFQVEEDVRLHDAYKRFQNAITPIFSGEKNVSELLAKRQQTYPERIYPVASRGKDPRINIDNECSRSFTVIEVFTHDQTGLLYMITQTLTDLNLDIHLAKIATDVDQVADIFYVKNREGQKIHLPEQKQKIEETLLARLKAQR